MRSRAPVLLAAAAVLLLSGCGGARAGGGAGGRPSLALDVVVPDAVLRTVGEPCAGGDPFLYVHATAPFRVLGARGAVVARGALPEGRAIPAFNAAAGGAPRVPTLCRVRLRLRVPPGARYRLVLAQGAPLTFRPRAGRATVVLG